MRDTGKWIKIISLSHSLFKYVYNSNLNATLKLNHAVQLQNQNETKTIMQTNCD